MDNENKYNIRIAIVGSVNVGKSSILYRLCRNENINDPKATIAASFQVKRLNIDGKTIILELWDTAGQERYRSVTKNYYREAKAVIIVYSVDNFQSFNNINMWLNDIKEIPIRPVIALVGNKIDLESSSKIVSHDEGEKLANEEKMLFYETSAKENINIEELFTHIAKSVLEKFPLPLTDNYGETVDLNRAVIPLSPDNTTDGSWCQC